MAVKYYLFLCLLYCLSEVQGANLTYYDELYEEISNAVSIRNIARNIVENRENVSAECVEDMQDFLRSFIQPNQDWGLKMIDSAGKIPHGIYSLNLVHMGSHGECVNITTTKTSGREMLGQHCMLSIIITIKGTPPEEAFTQKKRMDMEKSLTNIGVFPGNLKSRFDKLERDDNTTRKVEFKIALCFPSSCKASAINELIAINSSILKFKIDDLSCTTSKSASSLTPGDIATITFLSLVAFIMLCSTGYDLWFQIIKKGNKADQKPLYVAFSVYTNSQRLFTPSKNPGPLASVHGIRSLSLLWVVIGHRYSFGLIAPFENYIDVLNWAQTIDSAILLGGTVSVDSFFLMSGLLVSYTFFRAAKLQNISRELPMFYIHRIIRLTPVLAVVIILYSTLLKHYGEGPYKYFLDLGITQGCLDNWWTTLLYINNYVRTPTCVGQTWYLSVDMQLYVLSPFLLYPLLWNQKKGLTWALFWTAAAQASTFAVAFINKYPGGILATSENADYQKQFYMPMHTRAVPYLIGLIAGYFLSQSFKRFKITTIRYNFMQQPTPRKLLLIACWVCSLAILAAVVFGSHPLNQVSHTFNHWEDTIYAALSRTAWAIGLLWIIVACAFGFGGPINWFLSLPMWEILGRFSYTVYLTHVAVMFLLIFTGNHVKLFSHTHMVIDFFGDMIISLAVSYLLILAFESPIAILEKLIFKKPNKEETQAKLPMEQNEEVNVDIQRVQQAIEEKTY